MAGRWDGAGHGKGRQPLAPSLCMTNDDEKRYILALSNKTFD
jgi:hypothetical protein